MLRHSALHRRDPLSETALLGTCHASGIETSPHYTAGMVLWCAVSSGRGRDRTDWVRTRALETRPAAISRPFGP